MTDELLCKHVRGPLGRLVADSSGRARAVASVCLLLGVVACSEESGTDSASEAFFGTPNAAGVAPAGAQTPQVPRVDPATGLATPNAELPPGTPGAAAVVDSEGNVVEPIPELPDEEEVLLRFEEPAAGLRYVFAANPDNNSVAVIDSETLAIETVEAGDKPTFIQSVAGKDAAIVLNAGSDDATVIRTQGGKSTSVTLDVVGGSNAIAVSPDGRHAVVYFNADLPQAGRPGSFQDLSVLLLEEGQERVVDMTVGFEPTAVSFTADGERALVVTEDGVSILELEAVMAQGSHIAKTIALGPSVEARSLDVSVTPDGRYALARKRDSGTLTLADLRSADGALKTIDLGELFAEVQAAADLEAASAASPQLDAGAGSEDAGVDGGAVGAVETAAPADPTAPLQFTDITDVDLSPDGKFALAVVRDRRTVLHVPVPEAFDDISLVEAVAAEGELIGSVSIAPDGSRALLYTTALDDNERIAVLDLNGMEMRAVRLPKAVHGVNIAPDGQSALVVHRKLPGSPTEPGLSSEALIDRSFGYSILRLEDGFSKLQLTDAPLGPTTIVPDGKYLFILFNQENLGLRDVHRVALGNFLVDTIRLGSPPVNVGAVPGTSKVFVGQEHPDGRITFIDWLDSSTESVTGFELNSRIRE